METIFPLFMVCVMPLVYGAGMFLLGRWSASHSIRIERRGPGHASSDTGGPSAYYDQYNEAA